LNNKSLKIEKFKEEYFKIKEYGEKEKKDMVKMAEEDWI